jgi:ribosomal protein L11 methyltransferase
MSCYLFQILDGCSFAQGERELKSLGLYDLYVIEDGLSGELLIGGMANNIDTSSLKTCLLIDCQKRVSWTDQWSQFASDFRNGYAHIHLEPFGSSKTLNLTPGPGFGDLSHPTTYLMLELMSCRMKNETVIDVGCGSGILALAALRMGAKKAYGIDIDPEALIHARTNATLNHLNRKASFSYSLPKVVKEGIVLINMILSEQKNVLHAHPKLPPMAKLWIASGFLRSQRKKAIAFTQELNLELIEEKSRGNWLGCIFKQKSPSLHGTNL